MTTREINDCRKDFERECPVFDFSMRPDGYGYQSTTTEQGYKCYREGRRHASESDLVAELERLRITDENKGYVGGIVRHQLSANRMLDKCIAIVQGKEANNG